MISEKDKAALLADELLIVRHSGEIPEVALHSSIYYLTQDPDGPTISIDAEDLDQLKGAALERYQEIIFRDLDRITVTRGSTGAWLAAWPTGGGFPSSAVRRGESWTGYVQMWPVHSAGLSAGSCAMCRVAVGFPALTARLGSLSICSLNSSYDLMNFRQAG